MRKSLLCLALPLLAGGLLLQPAQSQKEPPPSTEELIQQLDSSSFRVRERAEQQLRERGPAVLPALRKAQKQAPLELHLRLERLIEHLEIVAALQPRRVTLTGKAQPLSAVLKEIERQTGYKIAADENAGEQVVSFKMKDVPFWEAVEAIEQKTGLMAAGRVEVTEETRIRDGIDLYLKREHRKRQRSPFSIVSGSFWLTAWCFHEDRDIDFTEPGAAKHRGQRDHNLTLAVSIQAEPKLTLLAAQSARIESAIDENGKPFGTFKEKEAKAYLDALHYSWSGWVTHYFPFDVQNPYGIFLRRPVETSRVLSTLRGVIPVHVVIERKHVVATKEILKSKGTKFKIGGDTFEIQKVIDVGDGYYLTDIALSPLRIDIDLRWGERIHLEDAAGKRYDSFSQSSYHRSDINEYGVRLGFCNDNDPTLGPPTHLIVEDWRIVEHAIPFEFRDVPLP